jgi:shikimate kinase
MGAGKTVVGSRVAELMGVGFLDLDRVIEAQANRPIAEIFAEQGEAGFRRLESKTLGSVAGLDEDLVVAAGGGTTTRQVNMDQMHSTGTIVWIDPPFEEILNRLDTPLEQERPLFESPAQARKLFEERRGSYSDADLRVEVPIGEEPGETAERILRMLSADGPPAGL